MDRIIILSRVVCFTLSSQIYTTEIIVHLFASSLVVDQSVAWPPRVRPAFEATGTQRKHGVTSAANIKKWSEDRTTGLVWNPWVPPMIPDEKTDDKGSPLHWHESTNRRNGHAIIMRQGYIG
jgi:hypothetical protein